MGMLELLKKINEPALAKIAEEEKSHEFLLKHTPSHVVVCGPPGVGKTHKHLAFCGANPYQKKQCSRGVYDESLIGFYGLDGWKDMVGLVAAREGHILLWDDLHELPPDAYGAAYSLLDGQAVASFWTPDGMVRPAPGYRVLGTTNRPPTELPVPIQDRMFCFFQWMPTLPLVESLAPTNWVEQAIVYILLEKYLGSVGDIEGPDLTVRNVQHFLTVLRGIGGMTSATINRAVTLALNTKPDRFRASLIEQIMARKDSMVKENA